MTILNMHRSEGFAFVGAVHPQPFGGRAMQKSLRVSPEDGGRRERKGVLRITGVVKGLSPLTGSVT